MFCPRSLEQMHSESTSQNSADEDVPSHPRISEEAFRSAHVTQGAPRDLRANGPGPEKESLRTAYLDLLKLSLVDLAGARTLSVSRTGDSRTSGSQVFSRELTGDELALRIRGADWPFSGLSMIGLPRLDDLQRCVESVVADDISGDLIEAGAWRGGASILMRATLDSLGEVGRSVCVADSFQGLPTPDSDAFPEDWDLDLSRVDFLAVPLEEVKGYFARLGCEPGVEFVPGFFADTLPTLSDRRWSLVRLDGDTYESTWVALESLYPGLSSGGFLIVDDYQLIDECRDAVDGFRREHGITEPIEKIDWNAIRWRRTSTPNGKVSAPDADRAEPSRPSGASVRAVKRPAPAPIPTHREIELERELRGKGLGSRLRGSRLGRWMAALRRSGGGT